MQPVSSARIAKDRSIDRPRPSKPIVKTLRIAGVEVTRMTGPTEDILERMKPHVRNPGAILAIGSSYDSKQIDLSIITDFFPGMPGGKLTREVEFSHKLLNPLFRDDFIYTALLTRFDVGFTVSGHVSNAPWDQHTIFSQMKAVADGLFPNHKVGTIQLAVPNRPLVMGGIHAFGEKQFAASFPSSFDRAMPAHLIPFGARHCLELSKDGTKIRVAALCQMIDTVQRQAKARTNGQDPCKVPASWNANPPLELSKPVRALSRGYTDSNGYVYAVATCSSGRRPYLGLQLVSLSKEDKRLHRLAMTNPLTAAQRDTETNIDLGDLITFNSQSGVFVSPNSWKYVMPANLPTIVLSIVRDTA